MRPYTGLRPSAASLALFLAPVAPVPEAGTSRGWAALGLMKGNAAAE
jgi:hypothetical protein